MMLSLFRPGVFFLRSGRWEKNLGLQNALWRSCSWEILIRGSVSVDLPVVTLEDRCMHTFDFSALLFSFHSNQSICGSCLDKSGWMDLSRVSLDWQHWGERDLGGVAFEFSSFVVSKGWSGGRADGIRKCSCPFKLRHQNRIEAKSRVMSLFDGACASWWKIGMVRYDTIIQYEKSVHKSVESLCLWYARDMPMCYELSPTLPTLSSVQPLASADYLAPLWLCTNKVV